MASPSPLSVDRDEGPPSLPFTERAHVRAAGLGEALPQRADGLGFHAGTPSRHQDSGRCRYPRDRRRAGSADRART
ncbi:hypothetical protein GCM10010398_73130 [Streptomyces fimbriatus]|uniref:hypothetical protein n=1 Tax=Streptomyces sp. TaxID=1931 RepID=UPI002811793B|nr:hypothetical protein [Streptomyces sp.]